MAKADQQQIMESRAGTNVVLNGKTYLYFAGTSYFQLHAHPDLINAACTAMSAYGTGSATTRAMTGTTPLIQELERKLAGYFNTEDAVYLPSGYLSSLAGLKALEEMEMYDVIFLDEESHYSLYDGTRATGKKVHTFRNRDLADLETKIKKHLEAGQKPLVASDGLFPVSGTLAPIRGYQDLAATYQGVVWIDDAHGVGILGAHGRGTCEALGSPSSRVYLGASLAKAFGAYGGFICGNREFIGRIRSGSVLTGSSSPMNAAVASSLKGLEMVQEKNDLRRKLWENARYMREGLEHMGIQSEALFIPEMHGTVPIFSFTHRDEATMRSIHAYLMKEGIYTQYTTYRGAGSEGVIRVVVTSSHKKVEIVRLTHTLREAFRSLSS